MLSKVLSFHRSSQNVPIYFVLFPSLFKALFVQNMSSTLFFPFFCTFPRWNLPVYFQIRFQEIGGPVEEACQDLFVLDEKSAANQSSGFHLVASDVIMTAIGNCWIPEVFLRPLATKFWKLTLQIIARYFFAKLLP